MPYIIRYCGSNILRFFLNNIKNLTSSLYPLGSFRSQMKFWSMNKCLTRNYRRRHNIAVKLDLTLWNSSAAHKKITMDNRIIEGWQGIQYANFESCCSKHELKSWIEGNWHLDWHCVAFLQTFTMCPFENSRLDIKALLLSAICIQLWMWGRKIKTLPAFSLLQPGDAVLLFPVKLNIRTIKIEWKTI